MCVCVCACVLVHVCVCVSSVVVHVVPVLLRRDELARVELPWPRELHDTHGTHTCMLRRCLSRRKLNRAAKAHPACRFAPLTVRAAKSEMYLLAGFRLTDDRALGLSCLLCLAWSS